MRIYAAILNRFPNNDEKFIVRDMSAFLELHGIRVELELEIETGSHCRERFFYYTFTMN